MRTGPLLAVVLLAGCGVPEVSTQPASTEPEIPTFAVSRWTGESELFMEYPALRVGATSRFAIHLTDLSTFQALGEGGVSVVLEHDDGQTETFATDRPSRPGIFGVNVQPSRPGRPEMTISVRSQTIVDSHALGPVLVSSNEGEIVDAFGAGGSEPADDLISYLKEQQWTLEFATQVAQVRSMQRSFVVPATVEARSGGRIAIAAPVSGRLLPAPGLPALGSPVAEGQELGAVIPVQDGLDHGALHLRVVEAAIEVEAAKRERTRLQRLVDAGAVPTRRLQAAEDREAVAVARKQEAEDRIEYFEASRRDDPHPESHFAFSIRSHLSGTVSAVLATDGSHVDEGDPLIEVTATDSVHVSGAVPEARIGELGRVRGAEIQFMESSGVMPVEQLVTTARVLDPFTRTLKTTYLVNNARNRLVIGQSVLLRLFAGDAVEAPSLPVTALVEADGRSLVYVQGGGESFQERQVETGNQQGQDIQIVQGLRAGERVVTRGAYLVRLASMTGETPAHGHVH